VSAAYALDYTPAWIPFPGMQTRALAAREFEVALGGAKGPGKTDLILMGAVTQTDKARYKALITRETGPQLAEIRRRSHNIFPYLASRPAWNGDGHGRWIFPGGSEVVFESIGTPDDVRKIHGHEYAYWGPDEAGNIPEERTIDLGQAEIRCPNPKVVRMWRGSANPGKAGHAWFKRRFVVPCGVDGRRIIRRHVTLPNGAVAILTRRYIPGTVFDNPIYANDPMYLAQLATLPEVLRKQLLYGDWDAGEGTALDELNEHVHIVPAFEPPDYWPRMGGFDYGYAHWWVWTVAASDEEGRLTVMDTARGRRQKPHELAERVERRLGHVIRHPSYTTTVSDTYPFRSKKEINDNTPTIQHLLAEDYDLVLSHGPNDRKAGLLNLRYALAWRGIGEGGRDEEPWLRFMDTPGNRWLFEQLQTIVTDPADPEDSLKVDADPETGAGGDDGYDALRVLVASRPQRAIGTYLRNAPVSAFSKASLHNEYEHKYRDVPPIEPQGSEDEGHTYTAFTGV